MESEDLQPVQPPLAQPEKVRRWPCAGCGGELGFDPSAQSLQCPYCGRAEKIPQSAAEVQENSYEGYLQVRPERLAPHSSGERQSRCLGCGAVISVADLKATAECAFCGAKIVVEETSSDPVIAPQGVLPFKIPRDDAVAALRKWLRSLWFAPNKLKHFARPDAINGVYLPFWTYDSHTVSYYEGERGEYYWVNETYTTRENGRTVTRTRSVRRTRWYPASGKVTRWFDDVLVPATKSLPGNKLEALEPWELPQIEPYDSRFLAGFAAERYAVQLAEGFERGKEIMDSQIRSDICSDIGGDTQRIHSVRTSYSGITFKHLLLPVWVGGYQYGRKLYQIMINARTGEVQGDRPYSFWKIFGAVSVVVGIVGLLLYYRVITVEDVMMILEEILRER